ncbi:PolC-type DNA polymerase III [Propionispira arboris]
MMDKERGLINMQKYCIIPKDGNDFWRLVHTMSTNDQEKKLLQECKIKHVEINLKNNSWEILLQTRNRLPNTLIDRTSVHIAEKCQINQVFFYQDVIDLEAYIEREWKKIVKQTAAGNPTVTHLLMHSKRHFDGNTLTLELFGELAEEILTAHSVIKMMKLVISDTLNFCCEIQYSTKDAAENQFSQADDFMTPEFLEALQIETQKKDAVAAKTGSTDKGTAKVNNSPLIFGKMIQGEAVPINDVDGEIKNTIFEGTMGDFDVREFKTGTKLLTFDIADKSDGISCKTFFKDKDEFERVQSALSKGMFVKIKGSIKFDTFQNDFVMFVDSMYKTAVKGRMDLATEKRVELHAHTHMSNMDAVVSVKKLVCTAAKWGWPAIAITDHGVVQAFPEAAKVIKEQKLDIKIIYGIEGYLVGDDYQQKRANHIILLAKNPVGLRNLYQMVSLAHLKYLHKQPRIPRKIIAEFREGVIVGSACEAGELIRAIVAGQSDEELLEIAKFYDYLEIQPIGNNEFLVRSEDFPDIQSDDDLIKINLKVAQLAKQQNKMLIATCDVHFLNPEDQIYRAILMKGKGFKDADMQPPLYLRTTEEMLAEFQYLGEEKAYEAVVTNPRKINEMIEVFKPIPDDLYSPMIPGADDDIKNMSYDKAKFLYGENLPQIVQDRLTLELDSIIGHGFAVLYLIAHKLVKKSLDDGYLVGSRGSVGSSFVATMTDITEVNPLPPHWYCPKCQYSEFITDGSYGCGFDLPDKTCPVCGSDLAKDGHDIPFAVFMGFDGDKVPDIDLNFSGDYQPVAHKYTEELFGKDNVFRAGTIATVADKTAYGYVRKYFDEKGLKKRNAYINSLVDGCTGVKRTTGQHPGGIMVIPRNMDVHHFTPIQHPADDKNTTTITTHFDYHSISSRLVKLDILGHDDPTVIKMLEDLTHRDPKTIPFDDPATMSIFSSTAALGVTPQDLGSNSGTFGIPEFRTRFTRQMLDDTMPKKFSDLVRISGFSHGTNVWLDNAQELIRNGTSTLSDAISARDDIMMYLIHKGIDPLLSFKTMENVRKGKGIQPDVIEKLKAGGIPDWYIESCLKIKYLFPRAHATAYVMMAYRIAFCKVHYPLAFYAAYFSIRAAEFDANLISQGKEQIQARLKELDALENLSVKDKGLQIVLELAWEMYIRGYYVEKVDLYGSLADKFVIHEKSLQPPFAALDGLGSSAAKNIVEARKDGEFSSIDDLKKRTGISKTVVEILREHGCLTGMTESDQMELFM